MTTGRRPASRLRLLVAFAALYLIWGSTYLAIRYAVETLPPLLMSGSRSLAAGTILWIWARRTAGGSDAGRTAWVVAALAGGLLFLGGQGVLSWAEQRVPSGLAALMLAMIPIWLVVLDWARPGGQAPGTRAFVGLALGFSGVAMLVSPAGELAAGRIDPVGASALLLAGLSWAGGSLVGRSARLPANLVLATAMKLLAGGAWLLVAGLMAGEGGRIDPAAITLRSALSLLYLTVAGSGVAFTAYAWLLDVSTPARVGSYAYVTPVIAMALGWAVAGEAVPPRAVLAAGLIVGSVVLIMTGKRPVGARQ